MNDAIPHVTPCGARTRAATKCRRAPCKGRARRCHLHGGKSLHGRAHPCFKHGHYSKYTLEGMARAHGLAVRRFERAMRREQRYIAPRLAAWKKAQRRGLFYSLDGAERALERFRREFWEQEAAQGRPRPPYPISYGLPPSPTSTPNW